MRKILFVDDDPLVGMMTTMSLRRLGHEVETFTSIAPALEAFGRAAATYDLVISDVNLGPESGFDLCRAILELRPDVPIVMASGLVEPGDVLRAQALGVMDVLPKSEVLTRFPQLLERVFH